MKTEHLNEARSGLTVKRLRSVLHYDPETGAWTWLETWGRAIAGEPAGCLKPSGYIAINLDGVRYRAHRLAWFYMTGEWPTDQVVHRDTIRSNNRWDNLRLGDDSQNQANAKRPKSNTSGFKGVFWSKQRCKWAAKINVNRRQIHLGFFVNIEDAAEAYRLGAVKYFGEFARAA